MSASEEKLASSSSSSSAVKILVEGKEGKSSGKDVVKDVASLDVGLIGNCTASALVDKKASIGWSCVPRFDGDPIFCKMLQGNVAEFRDKSPGGSERRKSNGAVVVKDAGYWEIELENYSHTESQRYIANTAVLTTTMVAKDGSKIEVVDFCPYFTLYGRTHHPWAIWRQIVPLHGLPRVRVKLRPSCNYGGKIPPRTHGSNHVRFLLPTETLRCTTDIPVSYIVQEMAFVLDTPKVMILGPDESLSKSPADIHKEFLQRTIDDWRDFVRLLAIPLEFQTEVIRAAITLRLCQLHDSGAIVAAMTTSIPEYENSGRNWDYRFCWLRDAYFVVLALNKLGATHIMEKYIYYLLNIISTHKEGEILQPCYGILPGVSEIEERFCETLNGYRGMGPVRVGNEAYLQEQNDCFGSIILACTQYFFDERLHLDHREEKTNRTARDALLFEKLEMLGREAVARFDAPDAGIWELRADNLARVHTQSAVLCWAACDRLSKIAASRRVANAEKAKQWRTNADHIHGIIVEKAFNTELNSFVAAFGTDYIDAALLLLPQTGFCAYDDPRFLGTLLQIEKQLKVGNQIKRYLIEDDFGTQKNAFNVCTFWYIQVLHHLGRSDDARQLYTEMLSCANHVGLLSEDFDPVTGQQWGNIPQTYSMCGVITCALLLSHPWEDII